MDAQAVDFGGERKSGMSEIFGAGAQQNIQLKWDPLGFSPGLFFGALQMEMTHPSSPQDNHLRR